MYIRMLKKAPYEVSYAGFTYWVEPVSTGSNSSCIMARLVTAQGVLWDPPCEHDLTARLTGTAKAGEVWSTGFHSKEDFFITRALVDRLLDEEAAELLEMPEKSPLIGT